MKNLLLAIFFCSLSVCGYAADKYYVFYLHGAIVEGAGDGVVHPKLGKYEYNEIIRALEGKGYTVLSEVRPKNTAPKTYARKIVQQIDSLKRTGVPSKNIAVIGASKGAAIAAYASGYAQDKEISYVLMGICLTDADAPIGGRVLLLNEKTDSYGQGCGEPEDSLWRVSEHKELILNTGLGHGFIYRPLPEWVEPAVRWIGK